MGTTYGAVQKHKNGRGDIAMSRAERRRAEREADKREKTYTLTQGQINKMKAEITADTINTAMTLMLVFPLIVLKDHYWTKTAEKRLPAFTDKVLDLYRDYQDGKVSLEQLQADLWEYGGVRLEERKEEP